MNIDGITAVIFCELGFEPELGRGLFVLSRSVGHPRARVGAEAARPPDHGADAEGDPVSLQRPGGATGAGRPATTTDPTESSGGVQRTRASRRSHEEGPRSPTSSSSTSRPAASSTSSACAATPTSRCSRRCRRAGRSSSSTPGTSRSPRTPPTATRARPSKASVVLSHLSPGLTNAATGVANAALDSIPMVVIAGDVPTHYYGKHPHQEVNLHADASQYEIYRPFVKRAWRVDSPHLFPEIIEKAFALAESGRPGPVLVDVPMDIFSKEIDVALFDAHARQQPGAGQAVARRGDRREDRRAAARRQDAAALRRRRHPARRRGDRAARVRRAPVAAGRAHADGQGRAARRPSADPRHDRFLGHRSSSTTSARAPTGSWASARASPRPTAARGSPSTRSTSRRPS